MMFFFVLQMFYVLNVDTTKAVIVLGVSKLEFMLNYIKIGKE